jgi:hypothetical protein
MLKKDGVSNFARSYNIFFFNFDVSRICSVAKNVSSKFAIDGKNLHNS